MQDIENNNKNTSLSADDLALVWEYATEEDSSDLEYYENLTGEDYE